MITYARSVGIQPGTTTMALGAPPAAFRNRNQDPGVPWLVEAKGLGDAVPPSDFDLAPEYGYLPVRTGWIEGKPALYGAQLLGKNEIPEGPPPSEADILKLQARAAQEQIKTHKHTRIWSAVGGMVGVGTLIVAIRALRR
jgi:hypothetical protein